LHRGVAELGVDGRRQIAEGAGLCCRSNLTMVAPDEH
jgi:hypothetical protein